MTKSVDLTAVCSPSDWPTFQTWTDALAAQASAAPAVALLVLQHGLEQLEVRIYILVAGFTWPT
jgi:hypothetical protein